MYRTVGFFIRDRNHRRQRAGVCAPRLTIYLHPDVSSITESATKLREPSQIYVQGVEGMIKGLWD